MSPPRAFPSWFLRIVCDRCDKERMISETHIHQPGRAGEGGSESHGRAKGVLAWSRAAWRGVIAEGVQASR